MVFGPVEGEERLVAGPDILKGNFKGGSELLQGVFVFPFRCIFSFVNACGNGQGYFFAAHFVAAFAAIGPSIGEHIIQPFLEEGRTVEPVVRELKYDLVVLLYELLLFLNVYFFDRVLLVQVVDVVFFRMLLQLLYPALVDDRLLQVGMDDYDQRFHCFLWLFAIPCKITLLPNKPYLSIPMYGTDKSVSMTKVKVSSTHQENKQLLSDACMEIYAANVIGGQWTLAICCHLLNGKLRFGELRKRLPNISERILTLQLRKMEAKLLVTRTLHAGVPPKVEYALTESGQQLRPILEQLEQWGIEHMKAMEG